jgi:hypothetical protein
LEQLVDPEALATWAHRALPLKNQLATADAHMVEVAFAARLGQLGDAAARPESDQASGHPSRSPSTDINAEGVVAVGEPLRTDPGDQAVMVISKPVRERDRDHLRFVTAQPCLVCGRTPSDAHHIKFAEQGAMGRKVSDRFTVPICRLHHRELHRTGNERAWWQDQGIDPLPTAATLWAKTHVAPQAEAEIEDDKDQSAEINPNRNGRHFDNGAGAVADRPQKDETKPIRGPEAG